MVKLVESRQPQTPNIDNHQQLTSTNYHHKQGQTPSDSKRSVLQLPYSFNRSVIKMKVVPAEEENDSEVRREDQDNINKFARLNARLHEIRDERDLLQVRA